MSDASVAAALRSSVPLVVVEAPAGCGKTYQGADYAREIAGRNGDGRVLILTHTHAACDVFASNTRGVGGRVDIRTIDSLIGQVAAAYHRSLGLPADTGTWARTQKDGYADLATKTARLLGASPMIVRSLTQRYPVIICDEHQDASADQHAVVMALHKSGASIRIFGDPMQRIYAKTIQADFVVDRQCARVQCLPGMEDFVDEPADRRWEGLRRKADTFEKLDKPHRWSNGSEPIGRWILESRDALASGGQVDLRGNLPRGVTLIVAENQSPKPRGGYELASNERNLIDSIVNKANTVLVLAAQNVTVDALRAFFFRRLPIWEGHVRENLSVLVGAMQNHKGNAANITQAVVTFLNGVATGFSPSAFGNTLLAEVSDGCVATRTKKPGTLQALGRMLLEQPDHKGVANMLRRLSELRVADPAFETVKVDYNREFWDAIRLGEFDDANVGLAELSRRRTYARPSLPIKAISTVHKAKGLQSDNVLIMPCDAKHFGDSPAARCLLYVAMSRSIRSLTFVVSRQDPSPLVLL